MFKSLWDIGFCIEHDGVVYIYEQTLELRLTMLTFYLNALSTEINRLYSIIQRNLVIKISCWVETKKTAIFISIRGHNSCQKWCITNSSCIFLVVNYHINITSNILIKTSVMERKQKKIRNFSILSETIISVQTD